MASSKEESIPETLKVIRHKADYTAVLQAMSHTNQNVTEAANVLGTNYQANPIQTTGTYGNTTLDTRALSLAHIHRTIHSIVMLQLSYNKDLF